MRTVSLILAVGLVAAVAGAGDELHGGSCSSSWLTEWTWNAVPGAEGYRLYWTTDPRAWPACQYVETVEPHGQDPAPLPGPGIIVYFQVAAVRYAADGAVVGESPAPAPRIPCETVPP